MKDVERQEKRAFVRPLPDDVTGPVTPRRGQTNCDVLSLAEQVEHRAVESALYFTLSLIFTEARVE